MKIELSEFIDGDLEAIADYVAEGNPARALSLVREIRAEIRALSKNPKIYRLRPEIDDDVRMAHVGRYAILFKVLENVVRIERVVYGGRDLPSMFQ